MLAIIDYDAGNIKSVEKAVTFLGETPVISSDPNVLLQSRKRTCRIVPDGKRSRTVR